MMGDELMNAIDDLMHDWEEVLERLVDRKNELEDWIVMDKLETSKLKKDHAQIE